MPDPRPVSSVSSINSVNSVIEGLRLSRAHVNILLIAALGVAFDSFDTYIVSYAMPSITAEWHLSAIATGVLASAGIWGMFLGALVWVSVALASLAVQRATGKW